VKKDLGEVIDALFRRDRSLTAHARGGGARGLRAQPRSGYVERPALFAALDGTPQGAGPPLVVLGELWWGQVGAAGELGEAPARRGERPFAIEH